MLPLYEDTGNELDIFRKDSKHMSPHLHKSLEIVYVDLGSLELGIMDNLFHMEKGDFAVIFPEIVHHYQVFENGKSSAWHLLLSPTMLDEYSDILNSKYPLYPIIKKGNLHSNIKYALGNLAMLKTEKKRSEISKKDASVLEKSFANIILARSLDSFELVDRKISESDIVSKVVSYIAANFRENISLTKMAKDLAMSPYSLSRVFSSTFHMNFNSYLNETRLDYAISLIQYTDKNITEIIYSSGFESQRTFNRVFQNKFHVSPREYKKKYHIT